MQDTPQNQRLVAGLLQERRHIPVLVISPTLHNPNPNPNPNPILTLPGRHFDSKSRLPRSL